MYKVAIIGCGRIGALLEEDPLREKPCTHLGAWKKLEEQGKVKVVAVCDTNEERLLHVVTKWEIPSGYTDYEKMLTDEKPDIVSVCVPTEEHTITRNVVRYHPVKIVFLEKPIAKTIHEAEAILRACRIFDVKLAINHTRRWDVIYRQAKKLIEEGKIGKVTNIICHFSGDTLNDGIHMADLFNWYKHENTKVAVVHHKEDYLIFEIDIFGSEGRIRISNNGRTAERWWVNQSSHFKGYKELAPTTFWTGPTEEIKPPMLKAVENIVECIENDTQPKCTGEDGLKALKTCLEWFE